MSQLDIETHAEDEDDAGASEYLPEEIRHLILTELSVSPVIAGRAFGLGVSSAYRAVRSGEIPSKRIGAKFAVPTSWLRQELGLNPAPQPQAEPAPQPQIALQSKNQQTIKSPKKKQRRRR